MRLSFIFENEDYNLHRRIRSVQAGKKFILACISGRYYLVDILLPRLYKYKTIREQIELNRVAGRYCESFSNSLFIFRFSNVVSLCYVFGGNRYE